MKTPLAIGITLLFMGIFSGVLENAHRLFDSGQYTESLKFYRQALTKNPGARNQILYNMGLCYVQMDSTNRALSTLRQAISPRKPNISSLAFNQIGVLHTQSQKYPEALDAFQRALTLDSQNQDAAFNYELLLRLIEREKAKQPQEKPDEQTQPDEQEDNSPDEPQESDEDPGGETDGESSEGEGDPDDPDSEEPMNLQAKFSKLPPDDVRSGTQADTFSLAKAREILEAMKQNEVRFLQQLKRAPVNSPTDSDKPKW